MVLENINEFKEKKILSLLHVKGGRMQKMVSCNNFPYTFCNWVYLLTTVVGHGKNYQGNAEVWLN